MMTNINAFNPFFYNINYHKMTLLLSRFYGSIYGGIVGDSYGSPFEFKERDSYQVSNNMEYNYNFKLPAGSFTDDTSMMMCLMVSLQEKNGFDHNDQMERYTQWSTNGICFDIGRTCSMAIGEYLFAQRKGTFDPNKYYGLDGKFNSGNGGIMRLAPIPIFYHNSLGNVRLYSKLSSQVTHANTECLEAAELMGMILYFIFQDTPKDKLLESIAKTGVVFTTRIKDILDGTFLQKIRNQIETTGYVVHTLEAALWGFMRTNNYFDGLLLLAKMGSDVDTVLCVYGQIAGAYYGFQGIPKHLVQQLQHQDTLYNLISGFVKYISI